MSRTLCIQTDHPPQVAAGLLRSRCQGGDRRWNGEEERQLFVARTPVQEGQFLLQGLDWRDTHLFQPLFRCRLSGDQNGSQLELRVKSSPAATVFLLGFGLLYGAGSLWKGLRYGLSSMTPGSLAGLLLMAVLIVITWAQALWKQRLLQKELLRLLNGRIISSAWKGE